jgi:hypothetical protein
MHFDDLQLTLADRPRPCLLEVLQTLRARGGGRFGTEPRERWLGGTVLDQARLAVCRRNPNTPRRGIGCLGADDVSPASGR